MINLKKINEEKLDNIDASDVIHDGFVDQFDDVYEHLFNSYKYENQIDDNIDFNEFEKNPLNVKDFENWLLYEFEYAFDNFKYIYEKLLHENHNTIPIFREMTVSKQWVKSLSTEGTKLGIYWSYDKNKAEAHWGAGQITVLLQSFAKEDDIDWISTFTANLHPILGEDEAEITLYEGVPLQLENLWIENKKIKLSNEIKNTIYTS